MALVKAARRLLQTTGSAFDVQATALGRRTMADYHIPKPDTSMDHVFGDNSFKLPYNFQPPSMLKTFTMFLAGAAIFMGPVWIMVSEDRKMQEFLDKLETAKAAKAKGA